MSGWLGYLVKIYYNGVENINLHYFIIENTPLACLRMKKILSTRAKILEKKASKLDDIKNLAIIPVRGPELDRDSFALKKLGINLC